MKGESKKLIENDIQDSPSFVKKNKNTKKISVSFNLLYGLIPIKAIASEKEWLSLENKFRKAFAEQKIPSLNCIRPIFSKRMSKKTICLLERYYKDRPKMTTQDFYNYFIEPAANNIKTVRPRGGNPHGLNPEESFEVKTVAKWVYVFLCHWKKKSHGEYPDGLKNYLKENTLQLNNDDITHLTISIVKKYCSLDTDGKFFDDSKIFYKKYIVDRPKEKSFTKRIKQALESIRYQPIRDPLSEIFHEKLKVDV